ncbi:MAG: NFACT RNA binding domain-containing protein [Oscillospiraceae bacterium]|nr:NFACT RNA binding domain-containing protein [Oscillospiraceae bacterium]
MALDGMFLYQLRHELAEKALDARVDRIHQPTREEIIIALRWKGGAGKLLLSANAGSPRIHFTEQAPENPKQPPMFCMLLRKHLGSARLVRIEQMGMDRILHLVFESVNELGDLVELTLAVEIMGRHSNLVLIDQNGRIIDAVKRIDLEMSSVRQVLPGMTYQLPPQQPDKLNLLEAEIPQVVEKVVAQGDKDISKALLAAVLGMSPLTCREAEHYAIRGENVRAGEMGGEQKQRLGEWLSMLQLRLREHSGIPTILLEPTGKPRDFSFLPIHQYRGALVAREEKSYSALLDSFYAERDLMDRMKQRSHDLLRLLANTSDRISRKIAAQEEELKECAQREKLKVNGDLIQANLHQMEKGQTVLQAQNFYDEALAMIDIPLDPALTPAKNAQKYYVEYRKLDTAEKKLQELIAQSREELQYLDTVFDSLARAVRESELAAVREELSETGYIKNYKGKNKKPEKLLPIEYRSSDGFTILVGRNNVQNDRLTLKDARNYDLWFHTQKIPGSHTVVVADGREIPERTQEEAAVIAAYHSRARDSALVPVDYTIIKNVKKPAGAKPGKVIYDQFKTAVVTPDRERVAALLVKE